MGRTERLWLVPATIAFVLALSATLGAANPRMADPPEGSPSWTVSREAFAQRVTASGGTTPSGRDPDSWRNAIELIVLAGTCAIAVAFYSAATAQRTDIRVRRRRRR